MQRPALAGLVAILLVMASASAHAQYWGSPYGRGYDPRPFEGGPGWGYGNPYWAPPGYPSRPRWGGRDWDEEEGYPGPFVQSGGERPPIAALAPRKISFPSAFPANGIVIDTRDRHLFFVLSSREALFYPISVGREGFAWTGTETISRKAEWPDWYPPEEMRDRDPRLPEKMTGGIRNPLGAMALYLGKTLYRIHGTNDAKSIGRAASSGCFRMLNGHIIDLASRVDVGTAVTVVKSLPPALARSVTEQLAPMKPAAAKGEQPS
jgi:lipoprotein-anchoring transpeptidase ErfK/SrfK